MYNSSGSIMSKREIGKHILQDELVADSHSTDVLYSVALNRCLDEIALSFICGAIVGSDSVVPEPDRHVYLGLCYRFEL